MELITHYHYIAGITIARVFIGFLFLFQGYDALFNIGLKEVTNTYQARFRLKGIPRLLTALAALFTSCSAFICGALLVPGVFETIALYLLGINLIITGIGFGMNEPLWDTRHVFPRLALVLLLLLTPVEWHSLSLDHLFFKL
ncbi:hypothetical protein [Fluviicola sp.]|uniref:hypothetical protein n=1 Tax=Fluviicola sp. TaxID=1917219 RepID=UPI0031D81014